MSYTFLDYWDACPNCNLPAENCIIVVQRMVQPGYYRLHFFVKGEWRMYVDSPNSRISLDTAICNYCQKERSDVDISKLLFPEDRSLTEELFSQVGTGVGFEDFT